MPSCCMIAREHRHAFNDVMGVGQNLLWNVRRTMLADGATHCADSVLDRTILRRTKPIIADIANNLGHALDHIATAARQFQLMI